MDKKSYIYRINQAVEAGDNDKAMKLVGLAEKEIANRILGAINGYHALDRALIIGVLGVLFETMKKELTTSELVIAEMITRNTTASVLTIGVDVTELREQMGGERDGTSKEM